MMNQTDFFLAAVKRTLDVTEIGQADTSALEKQIDEMVYALYGLTDEEIAVVEGNGKDSKSGKGAITALP